MNNSSVSLKDLNLKIMKISYICSRKEYANLNADVDTPCSLIGFGFPIVMRLSDYTAYTEATSVTLVTSEDI